MEHLVRDSGLVGATPLGTPGCKPTAAQIANDCRMEADKTTTFRAVSTRGDFLSSDRPEKQYSSKGICRWMSDPTELVLGALKRLGRFLEGRRRLVYKYPWQSADTIEAYFASSWPDAP